MSYKSRAKDRRIKNFIVKLLKIFKFKSINLSPAQKIVLSWTAISIFSLFLPWVNWIEWNILENSSFSNLVWNIWFVMFIYLMLLIANTISINKKEKIKFYSWLHFKDYSLTIVLWVFTLILWIISIRYIWWLQTFISEITQWKWIWLCITWSIIIIIWSIIQKKEFSNKNIKAYSNDSHNEDTIEIKKTEKEDNMKLPF